MNHESPPPSTPAPDLTGRELGDYVLLRRLGRGGMADVYLARQSSLGRNVALKILRPELARDASYVERFRREAIAAAALVQANIVQIYEVGEAEGLYFISQEYVQGRNLGQYVLRHGAVEPVMAINVLRQAALAIQEAGKQGVIHRDIKPENIMLSTKGEVKVTDFGLARINNDASQQALTQIGVTMGTPLYMSPEQAEGLDIDHRSDIYSLGVTAYHMLAGKPPFEGETALVIALQHVKDDAVHLATLRPDAPIELCNIVAKMMRKKRQERHADAKSLLKDLRKIKFDVDDDWEMIVEKLSVSEASGFADTTSFSQAKLDATRQLQNVMRSNVKTWWNSPGLFAGIGVLSLAGFFGGMFYANQTPPESLLNVSEVQPEAIPKKASAREQYDFARFSASSKDKRKQEIYYKAVGLHFPPVSGAPPETVLINRNAQTRLSEIYLDTNRPQDALDIFESFVQFERPMGDDFITIGYAGIAIVFDSLLTGDEVNDQAAMDRIREAIGKVEKLDALNSRYRKSFEAVVSRFNNQTGETDPSESGTVELGS